MWLALEDGALCLLYIVVFGVQAWATFLQIEILYNIYWFYAVVAFNISPLVQLAIPYLLIFATLERLVTLNPAKMKRLRQWFDSR